MSVSTTNRCAELLIRARLSAKPTTPIQRPLRGIKPPRLNTTFAFELSGAPCTLDVLGRSSIVQADQLTANDPKRTSRRSRDRDCTLTRFALIAQSHFLLEANRASPLGPADFGSSSPSDQARQQHSLLLPKQLGLPALELRIGHDEQFASLCSLSPLQGPSVHHVAQALRLARAAGAQTQATARLQ